MFLLFSGDVETILKNLQFELDKQIPKNIQFIVPGKEEKPQLTDDDKQKYNVQTINCKQITLSNVVNFINGAYDEKDDE